MDIKKRKAFNEKMGRQKFSKGGLIKRIGNRQYFASGGNPYVQDPSHSYTPMPTVGVANRGNSGMVSALGGPGTNTNNPDVSSNLINNFNAGPATVQAGTNSQQLQDAYNASQTGLRPQQDIAFQTASGVNPAVASQQQLLQQLQLQAAGGGPNPAQAQLAQNTAANTANTAALMAGQRGASSNVGLMARQIGQQGALTQQNAVGQAATLQAQQQLQFQQQQQALQSQMINQGIAGASANNAAAQNEQNILQNANASYNNAGVSMQNGINSANAATSAANSGAMGQLLGGVGSGLAAAGMVALMANKGGEIHPPQTMAAGGVAGAGAALQPPGTAIAGAGGPGSSGNYTQPMGSGEATQASIPNLGTNFGINNGKIGDAVANYMTKNPSETPTDTMPQMPIDVTSQTAVPAAASSDAGITSMIMPGMARGGNVHPGPHKSHVANFLMAKGGPVEAMVSPGEIYLSPNDVHKVVHEGANPLKMGKKFLGKPKVKGDSLKNDTIPTTLEEGGVVIPRHIMNKKSSDKAELFVRRAVHMRAPKKG